MTEFERIESMRRALAPVDEDLENDGDSDAQPIKKLPDYCISDFSGFQSQPCGGGRRVLRKRVED